MSSNPLNHKNNGNSPNATNLGPNPGDFPIGSLESRAAARAMLARRKPKLSEYDQDCLTIYDAVACLGGQGSPSSWDLQGNSVFTHGQALSFKLDPIIPEHLNEPLKRSTSESRQFELAFGREPDGGDILRFEHVALMHHPEMLEADCRVFTDAWARRLPDLPSPQKFEDGRLFIRSLRRVDGENKEIWVEDEDVQAKAIWREFERYIKWIALGRPNGLRLGPLNVSLDDIPTIPALTFIGVGPVERSCGPWPPIIENKHRCRPSTPEELAKPEPEPKAGMLKTFREHGIVLKNSGGGHYELVTASR